MDEITARQAEFLKEHRRHHHLVAFCRFLAFFLFLAAWEISTDLHLIDAFIFSSPSRIVRTIIDMSRDGSIFRHTGITLYETLLSFALVILVSFLTATVLWFSNTVSEILEPWLVILNSLPKSALAPLLIVWLGASTRTIIVAGMSVAVFGSIISMYTAFRDTDGEKLKLIYTLGGNRLQAGLLDGGLDLAGGEAVQAGQFHAIVADLLNLLHSAGKVLFRVLADGIDLHGNGQSFHRDYLL